MVVTPNGLHVSDQHVQTVSPKGMKEVGQYLGLTGNIQYTIYWQPLTDKMSVLCGQKTANMILI